MILWPCNIFISWIGLDACIGIHVLLVLVRVGSCQLDPSQAGRGGVIQGGGGVIPGRGRSDLRKGEE